ncbi:MAG: hypothetical protein Q8P93_04315 [bacterium]|nr:hypothetical protein [bacterium]
MPKRSLSYSIHENSTKKNPIIEYDYIVHHITDGSSRGYNAVIPALNGVVYRRHPS